jgi:hypothetical protein
MDVGDRPCDQSGGLMEVSIWRSTVNVDEQRHIMEGIYRSRQSQSAGASLQSTKRGPKRGQRVGSSKRAREQPDVSEPKQPSIGTYFQLRNKTLVLHRSESCGCKVDSSFEHEFNINLVL